MLVSCPECGRKVSDSAQTCPGCGYGLAGHRAVVENERWMREYESQRRVEEASRRSRAQAVHGGGTDWRYCAAGDNCGCGLPKVCLDHDCQCSRTKACAIRDKKPCVRMKVCPDPSCRCGAPKVYAPPKPKGLWASLFGGMLV